MATGPLHAALRHLQPRSGGDADPAPDGELLDRFVRERDEGAFATLVRRHGPMVLDACRRALADPAAADDAFQATFLVLVRRAGSIRRGEQLGNWLYGVACRVAARAKVEAARRRAREAAAAAGQPARRPADPLDEMTVRELFAALDEEILRLPGRYRAPLVLCHLQGRTRDEAARELGCPLGTLKRRLECGREVLRARLAGRGLTLSGAVLATVLGGRSGPAAVPAALAGSTVEAATAVAGGAAAGPTLRPEVAALTEGVLRAMVATKLKTAAAVAATVALVLGALLPGPAAGVGGPTRVSRMTPTGTTGTNAPAPAKDDGTAWGKVAGGLQAGIAFAPGQKGTVRSGEAVRFVVSVRNVGKGPAECRYPTRLFFEPGLTPVVYDAGAGGGRVKVVPPPMDWSARLEVVRTLAPGEVVELGSPPRGRPLAAGEVVRRGGERVGGVKTIELGSPRLHVLPPGGEAGAGERPAAELTPGVYHVSYDTTPPTGKLALKVLADDPPAGKEVLTFRGHTGRVHGVAYSPDGIRLASAGDDKAVRVWDAATGKELLAFEGHNARVYCVAFGPTGDRVASGDDRNVVKVWDPATGKEILSLEGHSSDIKSVAFSRDGKRLASAGQDGVVKVWDAQTGKEVHALNGHEGRVFGTAIAPDGDRLASAGADGTVRVWDLKTGKEALTIRGQGDPVNGVAFSPDGTRLASGGNDGRVRVWDPATGKELLAVRGHTADVRAVAYSRDGKHLATAGEDETAGVWDAATGRALFTCAGHAGDVTGVAFGPDGKRLASSGKDGTVRVWELAVAPVPAGRQPAKEPRRLTVELKSVSATERTLSVVVPGTSVAIDGGDKRGSPLTVAKDAKVVIDGKNARFADLKDALATRSSVPGSSVPVILDVAPDGLTVTRVEAVVAHAGPGGIASVSANKNRITLVPRGENPGGYPEYRLDHAEVFIDGRKATPADLKAAMPATVQFGERRRPGLQPLPVAVARVDATAVLDDCVVEDVADSTGEQAPHALWVTVRGTKLRLAGLGVRKDAAVFVDDKASTPAGLRPGMRVSLELAGGSSAVVAIRARN